LIEAPKPSHPPMQSLSFKPLIHLTPHTLRLQHQFRGGLPPLRYTMLPSVASFRHVYFYGTGFPLCLLFVEPAPSKVFSDFYEYLALSYLATLMVLLHRLPPQISLTIYLLPSPDPTRSRLRKSYLSVETYIKVLIGHALVVVLFSNRPPLKSNCEQLTLRTLCLQPRWSKRAQS